MAYNVINIKKADVKAPGAGGGYDKKIIFIDAEDVQSFPAYDNDSGLEISGNIVMKPGKYAFYVEATEGTVRLKHEGVGERDGKIAKIMVEFSHPGNELAVEEFLTNSLNKDYYIALVNYRTGQTRLCGTPGNTLMISANSDSGTKGDEPNKTDFVLENVGGERAAFYNGVFTMLEEVILAAGATSINASAGNVFVTQANTGATAIAGITNTTAGQFITIRGGSDTNATTIADGAPFELTAAWTASKGAELILWLKSSTEFIEVQRS